MDKICRGSQVAEMQSSPGHAGACSPSGADRSRHARGTHVTVQSFKLENQELRDVQSHPRSNFTSDTFRSGDWFKHNERGAQSSLLFSPRSRRPGGGSPPASPREHLRQRQTRSLVSLHEDVPVQAAGQSPEGTAAERRAALRSSRSEACLTSPRGADGAASPTRGGGDGDGAQRRTGSPTYRTSENWMTYSAASPRRSQASPTREQPASEELMPSKNFGGRAKKQHNGRQMESSVEGIIRQQSPRSPPPSAAAEGNKALDAFLGGKRVNIAKESDTMRRRLRLDSTQKEAARSTRKIDFSDDQRTRSPCGAQHRTSPEMGAALMQDRSSSKQKSPERDTKYFVGDEVVSWSHPLRRGAPNCMRPAMQQEKAFDERSGAGTFRDHRNSDAVREHLQDSSRLRPLGTTSPRVPPAQMQSAPVLASAVPSRPTPSAYVASAATARAAAAAAPAPPTAPFPQQPLTTRPMVAPPQVAVAAGQLPAQRILSFGEFSTLPSSTPKDIAYLQSGLTVAHHVVRRPGAFSPHAPRQPAAQVLQMGPRGVAC